MRGKSALLICLIMITGPLIGVIGTGEVDSVMTRGSFATHDTGNFTINIGDDGGATGWDTLEFPAGEDRLSSASFGIGTASDSVDFGSSFEFETEHGIEISSPGNYTDEEGFAIFSGWSGEDFDDVNITQRTFANEYKENTRGYCGRWFVVDYEFNPYLVSYRDIHLIQTLNVDLGASASDDSFSFMDDINATVISDGGTFIGMAVFTTGNWSRYHGHNAGEYGPSVYNTESSVWDQMYTPNNLSSSATQQDWYMDIVAKVDKDDFTNQPFHVSFIIMVGNSQYDIRNAYFDAVNGLTGEYVIEEPPEWTNGNGPINFQYFGPFPPISSHYTTRYANRYEFRNGEWHGRNFKTFLPVDKYNYTVSNFHAQPEDWVLEKIEFVYITPFNSIEIGGPILMKVDRKGPDTVLMYDNTDPPGTLKISTSPDDRGGSGVFTTYLSIDNETFTKASSLQMNGDRENLNFYSYSVDNVGHRGEVSGLEGIFIDGTPPEVNSLEFYPGDIDDKYEFPASVVLYASDEIAGIDHSSVEFRYGFEEPTRELYGEWMPMTFLDGAFTGSIDEDFLNRSAQVLKTQVRLSDELGNRVQREISDLIDSINDPPKYSLHITELPYVTTTLGITVEGNDPDGDLVTFDFEMKLGDGSWSEIPAASIEKTDENHFLIDLPNVTFEGSVYITGSAFDGTVSTPMNIASIPMDRKAPVIDIEGIPSTEWSKIVVMNLSAIDEVSGVDDIWYLDEMNGEFRLYPSDVVILSETGSHNITVITTDNAGNTRSLELDTIKIDSISPETHGIQFDPQDPRIGDDFRIEFTAFDLHSLPYEKLSQQPDLYLDVWLEFDLLKIYADSIIPVSGEINRFLAIFNDPFDVPLTGGMMMIYFTDDAGNKIGDGKGPINVGDVIPECPLDIDYPDPVGVGQRFDVTLTSKGPVIFEAKYPGTSQTWIITPLKVEGDEYTYKLPGSYGNGDIQFRVHHGEEDAENTSMTCPEEGWFIVTVTGWQDTDGDGLGNTFENLFDLDPKKSNDRTYDLDGDGLTLIEEMNNLTDPNEKDSDGDGMDDGWESEMGTLPFREDQFEDPDDDTWSNLKEYDGNTDPRDPEDHPEELPVTPWYWILLIVLVLLGILGFFIFQLFQKRKLEDDLEDAEEELDWDRDP